MDGAAPITKIAHMAHIYEKLIHYIKGYYPVRIGDQEIKADPAHLFFWRIVNEGGFEPGLFAIFDRFLTKESVYCDIGAWIGPTALYASKLCKQVYAFEPDPKAWKFLIKNIARNNAGNIIPYQMAIGRTDGTVKMASHGRKPGDSMTSMVNISRYRNYFKAKAINWDTFINTYKPGKIDFIKMDIEGGEIVVIPAMREYLETQKPMLHLSLHPSYLSKYERVDRIRNIFNKLSFYREVRDEQMEIVDVEKYLDKIQRSLDFRSFLFIP